MTLCDVGNTNATFYRDGFVNYMKIADFERFIPSEKTYYINVNDRLCQKLLSDSLFVDLGPFFELKTKYLGLGIDRVAACCAIFDGVIIDAGSAITVDIMSQGEHKGGIILQGISRQLDSYAKISPRLDIVLNSKISLETIPQNTASAVSYGIIAPIILTLKHIIGERPAYFTGGDGEFLSKFFERAIFDRMLIFRSMIALVEKKGL